MTTYEGAVRGDGARIALVCSRFNLAITERLLAGALDGLRSHGVDHASITVAWVPGAFELPVAAARLAASGDYDAIVCLGAVIRGATGHYEQVAGQCAAGIQRAQMDTGVPVIFGVLTTDTVEQALERAGVSTGEARAREYERREHVVPVGDRGRQQAGTVTGGLRTEQSVIQPEQEPAGAGADATEPADAGADATEPADAGADATALAGAGTDATALAADANPPPLSNKGYEAALAALEMCDLLRQLPKSPRA